MNVYTSQNSIVEKLQNYFTENDLSYTAFNLPDSQDDFKKAVVAPIVYVAYTGSKPLPSAATRAISQPRKLKFNIEIHSRSLYSNTGLYAVRDLVEQLLIGFKPTNCQKLSLSSDDIDQTADKIWVHVYQMECETMLVEVEDADSIVVPNFQNIT